MQLRALVLGAVVLVAAGCGGPTPYQPQMNGEGFAEQRLEADRFRVRVAGNSLTERETVQNQLLFRAAELTVANGFDRFVVVTQEVEPHTRYVTFDPFPPRRHWLGFPSTYETHAVTNYEAWAEIKMYRAGEGPRGADVYEARAVMAQLRNAIVVPKAG